MMMRRLRSKRRRRNWRPASVQSLRRFHIRPHKIGINRITMTVNAPANIRAGGKRTGRARYMCVQPADGQNRIKPPMRASPKTPCSTRCGRRRPRPDRGCLLVIGAQPQPRETYSYDWITLSEINPTRCLVPGERVEIRLAAAPVVAENPAPRDPIGEACCGFEPFDC
jgi:hypothetical protein